MNAYAKAFWVQKNGNSEAEYEDACFPRHTECRKGHNLRFAVADGASAASFSNVWARMLTSAFVRRTINLLTSDELCPLQENWKRKVGGRPLPWYAEEKLARGSFSTFLGLELTDSDNEGEAKRSWQAVACGDSCLVQVRSGEMIAAFPLKDSAAFTSVPDLVSTLPGQSGEQNNAVITAAGSWMDDDTFFMMTDALACWFFKEKESDCHPWDVLRDFDTRHQMSFLELITSLRSTGALKNDDVTLMRVDILSLNEQLCPGH